jgi:hypothetical protein
MLKMASISKWNSKETERIGGFVARKKVVSYGSIELGRRMIIIQKREIAPIEAFRDSPRR